MNLNLQLIFEKQKILDSKFSEYSYGNNLISENDCQWEDKVVIAAIVEIAEFANEIESFKYWKVNKKSNFEKTIEEFVDAIHFLVSACLHFKTGHIFKMRFVPNADINTQFKQVFILSSQFLLEKKVEILIELFEFFLGFIKLLGWTFDQVTSAYLEKYEKNLERIRNQY
ncbi:dUTP diphosphatase [Mycoplasma sp. 'Moose RK']|uniref:dUTP diphosphatase n=1 Tax=Mycoplasma sp. 'Moose RK' TaxID=2780095 RepID=UPI0018C32F99|nr:dUTP diphosphatase [Mycoplasma sp. 'Moose RK']MBG0730491.1 dUTP diphosphatase [Mycoplasma sp. 'Moose RK']